jgi:hypothetical protein
MNSKMVEGRLQYSMPSLAYILAAVQGISYTDAEAVDALA